MQYVRLKEQLINLGTYNKVHIWKQNFATVTEEQRSGEQNRQCM